MVDPGFEPSPLRQKTIAVPLALPPRPQADNVGLNGLIHQQQTDSGKLLKNTSSRSVIDDSEIAFSTEKFSCSD